MVDKETKNKLKEREKLVKEELKHIPKGDRKQNEFRRNYKVLRMYNFDKKPNYDINIKFWKEEITNS
ncbi:MAG: hypothetical protein O8C67_07230 [Candidatus Methanoperedens sp.]|nr:hypothetical protein [Candidatus Methanoperedens sp.]MCZ7404709.1 hypothetical protein [Candidatus Methanoperedens sp.]